MKTAILATVSAASLLLAVPAAADSMRMESIGASPANSSAGVPRPQRGSSMERVRAKFGEPQQVLGPVGDPPITQWVFADYTVYFEHNRVIHAVVHRDLRASSNP